jgi:uncharacterized protein
MDTSENRYVGKAKEFIRLLSENGVPITEAYLFGSAARGESTEVSDIDVAVVSPAFQGILFHDINKISKYRRKVDLRLEIHPFSLMEIESDPPAFFQHIQKEGIRVH